MVSALRTATAPSRGFGRSSMCTNLQENEFFLDLAIVCLWIAGKPLRVLAPCWPFAADDEIISPAVFARC